ncbi:GlxA family transcriptional regulator [Roseovarius phycicola]|uniref:Helix-turn-helix domain-containing protein n=1 Tax=Roseovarius phycicola TaxID=3080976 RepID=A0ABZ2HJ71_9RHOB
MFHSTNSNGYVAVVLMDGFSALSLGAIVEPFSYLSQAYPDIAPNMILVGLDGLQTQSQSGVEVHCDEDSKTLIKRLNLGRAKARIIVCGPTHAGPVQDHDLSSVLRAATRHGASICTLGGATWKMAEIGLLKDRATTVHWSLLAAFSESYAEVDTRDALYIPDEKITSCAGETATLDMVLELISSISPAAAERAANHFLVASPRNGLASQPGARANRLRGVPSLLSDAVRVMADNIEEPLKAASIATYCNVSVRKLERLFQSHLGTSPIQYYTQLRMGHARDLLMQTDMSLLDIAVASGFSSTGLLTKKFKKNYGLTPTQMRNEARIGTIA